MFKKLFYRSKKETDKKATSDNVKNRIDYFESPLPEGTAQCSDNECPCGTTYLSRGEGYMFISKDVVKFRKNAKSVNEAYEKINNMPNGHLLLMDKEKVDGIIMCEQGARLRNLDLKVANNDAQHWWKTGLIPLRPTPFLNSGNVKTNNNVNEEHTIKRSTNDSGKKEENQINDIYKNKIANSYVTIASISLQEALDHTENAVNELRIKHPNLLNHPDNPSADVEDIGLILNHLINTAQKDTSQKESFDQKESNQAYDVNNIKSIGILSRYLEPELLQTVKKNINCKIDWVDEGVTSDAVIIAVNCGDEKLSLTYDTLKKILQKTDLPVIAGLIYNNEEDELTDLVELEMQAQFESMDIDIPIVRIEDAKELSKIL